MIRLSSVATGTRPGRSVRAVVARPIVTSLVCGLLATAILAAAILATAAAPVRAAWVGNELTARVSKADGATGVFYTNFVPMPGDGIVDTMGMYFQGINLYLGVPGGAFNMYQVGSRGTANE